MPFLYILTNQKDRKYIGITKLMSEDRLQRHNNGDVLSTKFGKPWKLIYTEYFETLLLAREREKLIKSWKGGNALKKLLSEAAGSSNGRTSPFGGGYLGSNPSPAAMERKNR